MHTVDHFENEGWFNCDQEIIWMCFVCLLAKQHTMLKWKDAVSVFAVSQGSAEPLDRWCRKTNHRLISYFLSNTSAKNYLNRIMYDNIITSQTWDVFWDSVRTKYKRYIHTCIIFYAPDVLPAISHQCQALKQTQSTNLNQWPGLVHHWTPDEGCVAPLCWLLIPIKAQHAREMKMKKSDNTIRQRTYIDVITCVIRQCCLFWGFVLNKLNVSKLQNTRENLVNCYHTQYTKSKTNATILFIPSHNTPV